MTQNNDGSDGDFVDDSTPVGRGSSSSKWAALDDIEDVEDDGSVGGKNISGLSSNVKERSIRDTGMRDNYLSPLHAIGKFYYARLGELYVYRWHIILIHLLCYHCRSKRIL